MKINERQKAALRTAQIGPLFARGRSYRRDGGHSIGISMANSLVAAGLLEAGSTRFKTPMVKITDAGLEAIGVRRGFICSSPDEDQSHACSLHDRIAP